MTYEFVEHTADVQFIARGKTLHEAFMSSAHALFDTMHEGSVIGKRREKKITVAGTDLKSLLYNFLEEFIFLLDSEGFICSEVVALDIDEEEHTLSATVIGDSEKNYAFTNSVKAPTYNDMEIACEKNGGGWKIVCVLDV